MKLIARKPCSFGGKKFYIGEEIPCEHVLDAKGQEKKGVLAIVADDAGAAPPATPAEVHNKVDAMTVVIHADEGDLPLELTTEGLQAVVDAITSKLEEAETIIEKMTDGDALILVHILDSRKGVKAAAETRAQTINAGESAGDQ